MDFLCIFAKKIEMASKFFFSWPQKILFLFCGMMVALFVVALSMSLFFAGDTQSLNFVIVTTIAQNVVVFILPVVLLSLLNRRVELMPFGRTLWTTKGPRLKSVLLVVLVWMVAMPAMNYVVEWNQSLAFPSWLQWLEQPLRDMETEAANTTGELLNTHSLGMMIFMVLVVGVLTGLGEEIFFRSGLLGTMLYGRVNRHVAVWVVAIVFSAIHLQFFGFVPRILLGAWLGYLMVWTGEVWTPIIAHSLNNASIVVVTYLANQNYISTNYLETTGSHDHWLALGSVAATALVLVLFMRKSPNRDNKLTT